MSGSSCNYKVDIDNTAIGTSKPKLPTDPSIGETLSTGDRNTLALAFFFSSILKEENLDDIIVIVDDPVSSLDDQRSLATVQELREISSKVGQLIILSHKQSFLDKMLKRVNRAECLSLAMIHTGNGSTIQGWNIGQASNAEQSQRQCLLEKYAKDKIGNPRAVAEAIRPFLEEFLEVSCASHYSTGQQIGPFLNECKQKFDTEDEILDRNVIAAMLNIFEYAHQFKHNLHDAEGGNINSDELRSYVRRALDIVKPSMNKTP